MSYVALYRKFRPQTFDEVKGQDAIVRALKNQVRADRIGHAYLFCGTRGTGKTSVAKILARAVNCEHPVDGNPCGECASCRTIAAGRSLNVAEIDGASNTGVDNVRQIIEEVAYPPTEGRFRVYIIDEVHMITNQAFNALLKTLEEPPAHVIFILATTEAHKIPVTILSRCQRYDFRRISLSDIEGRINELLSAEGVEAEPEAVRFIARAADGSMRDALSLLDQCIAFFMDEKLTYEKVLSVLGAADTEVFARLLSAIGRQDAAEAVSIVEEAVMEGREPGQLVSDFLWYLRNVLMVRAGDGLSQLVDLSAEQQERLRAAAQTMSETVILRLIDVLSELSNQMRFSAQKRVLLEIAAVRLCRPQMDADTGALQQRIEQLEQQAEEGVFLSAAMGTAAQTAADGASGTGTAPGAQPAEKHRLPAAVAEEVKEAAARWDEIVGALPPGTLKAVMDKVRVFVNDQQQIELIYDPGDAMTKVLFTSTLHPASELAAQIEEAVSKVIGRTVSVRISANTSGLPKEKVYEDAVAAFAKQAPIAVEEEDF